VRNLVLLMRSFTLQEIEHYYCEHRCGDNRYVSNFLLCAYVRVHILVHREPHGTMPILPLKPETALILPQNYLANCGVIGGGAASGGTVRNV
jgi:hypothetical protein